MNLKSKLSGDRRNGLIGAGLAVFAGLVCLFARFGDGLSYDLPYLFRPATAITNAAIVYMDEDSHHILGQPANTNWDRAVHAQLLDKLTAAHARAVVFDVYFDGTTPSDDALLAAIGRATNAGTRVFVAALAASLAKKGELLTGSKSIPPFERMATNVPWGLVEASLEDRVRRWHFQPAKSPDPTLAWQVAQATATNLPADPTAERWYNYYGPPGTIPARSFHEVVLADVTIAPAEFSNKVVYVGANFGPGFTGGTGTDHFRAPHSHWSAGRFPGVEVNATAYLNLVRGDWLNRLPPLMEFLLVLGLGSAAGFFLPMFRPTVSALSAALIGAAVLIAAVWLMWQHRLWFSWVTLAGVQFPVALGWSVLAHTKRLQQEKEDLEEKLTAASATRPPATQIVVPARGTGLGSSLPVSGEAPTVVDAAGAAGRGAVVPQEANSPSIPDHALLRKVGAGAYGEIWLARNAIGTHHVVKIVRRESFDNPDPYEREFRGIQKFMPISRSHPGLVQILHVGRNDQLGYIYYIMEVADDETTGQEINPETYSPKNLGRAIKRRGRIPAEECLRLSLDLTAALEFMHQQHLIHRDIKPSNIIFVRGAPKFADIGLVTDIATKGEEVTYLGTRGYIAPEGPGTPAADVYSLGKVIYEASMGLECQQYPELPSTLLERADRAELFQLNEIILKACHDDRTVRYQSAAQLHAALVRLQTTLQARPPA